MDSDGEKDKKGRNENMDVGSHISNGFYLALVYLVISGNYLGSLFGCKIQQLFRENMLVKHVLGLFTSYFLIILSTPPENYTAESTLVLTLVIYMWFFLTTKMHVYFWIPMILSVLGAYLLWVYKKQKLAKEEEWKKWVESIQRVAVLFAGVLTAMGVVAYYGEKKLEYGDDFTAWKFWMGVPECRYATPPVSITTSMLAAFGMKP
jgi:hypothetical protein